MNRRGIVLLDLPRAVHHGSPRALGRRLDTEAVL